IAPGTGGIPPDRVSFSLSITKRQYKQALSRAQIGAKFMGLRGPGARPGRYRQSYYGEAVVEPDQKRVGPRRLKLLQRLQTLAHGTGLNVELAGLGGTDKNRGPNRARTRACEGREMTDDRMTDEETSR